MKLSLVVPCYNEQENIELFHNTVLKTFGRCGYDFEIIYIDDGSRDQTLDVMKKMYMQKRCPVKVVSFSRNFGKEAGIYAGLKYADGEYTCIIDVDLQQSPAVVLEMVQLLDEHEEYDVIATYQEQRNERKLISFLKGSFYRLISFLSKVSLRQDASDFRTFRKSVKDSILEISEYHRFSKGIFAWVGFDTYFIPYSANARVNGTTKWSFVKLFNYAIEGIIGYSTAPLKMATILGGVTGVTAFIYMLTVIIQKLMFGIAVPGYATIIVLLLFFSSIQLFCIGVVGEYVGRIFEQSKNRPIYIAKEILLGENNREKY